MLEAWDMTFEWTLSVLTSGIGTRTFRCCGQLSQVSVASFTDFTVLSQALSSLSKYALSIHCNPSTVLGAEGIMMSKKGYGPCSEELKGYSQEWKNETTHKDMSSCKTTGLGRRGAHTSLKIHPKSRIWSCLAGRLPWGGDKVGWEPETFLTIFTHFVCQPSPPSHWRSPFCCLYF